MDRVFVLAQRAIHFPAMMILCVLLLGCGGPSNPEVFPVQGIVHVDGSPAAGVMLTLHPVKPGAAIATAVTDGEGSSKSLRSRKMMARCLANTRSPRFGAN